MHDSPAAVEANRAVLARHLAAQPVYLQQVHGWHVHCLDRGNAYSVPAVVADASYSQTPGLACTAMVADCLPVLIAHRSLPLVGAAHAGWRGLAGQDGAGVLEAVLKAMQAAATDAGGDSRPGQWLVWLGPCIGPGAFEVGADVRTAFMQTDPGTATCFVDAGHGKWLANLPGLARRRLGRLGLTHLHGNDGTAAWCTYSQPQRFYSFRRDGVTGRFAAAIWIRPDQMAAVHPVR